MMTDSESINFFPDQPESSVACAWVFIILIGIACSSKFEYKCVPPLVMYIIIWTMDQHNDSEACVVKMKS